MRTRIKRSLNMLLAIFICISLTPLFSACGTLQNIHVDRSVNTATPESACAKAYREAQHTQHLIENAENNRNNKNSSADKWEKAAKTWKIVAKECPGRLSESIVYNSKAQWAILSNESNNGNSQNNKNTNADTDSQSTETNKISIAQKIEHEAYVNLIEVVNHYKNVKWTHQPLAQASAAEDKLAFILQTLAAKKIPGFPLEYSDIAMSNAECLMHAAGEGADLRKKIYDIPQKALESGIAQDPASGKDLPIAAIAYMDCARAELTAFNQIIVIEENKTRSSAKNNRDETSYEYSAVQAHKAFKDAVIKLITSRLLRAYALGYPTETNLVLK